jgi:hypothetical protein
MALNDKQLELKLCPIGFELLEEENDVDASRGGNNIVFHYCDPTVSRDSYAGCLNTLEAIVEGRGHLRPDCEEAVRNGTCPAVAMRKQELMANRALYFVNYKELMRRRGLEWESAERVVQYGRRRHQSQPLNTTRVNTPPVITKPIAPKHTAAPEIHTDILQKVLKKKVKDESESN